MPNFASKEYWEQRFTKDASAFDWLLPARTLRDVCSDWIARAELQKAEVLHIGCGTSDCLALRTLVANPEQIHNVDFSTTAIAAVSSREVGSTDGSTTDGFTSTENLQSGFVEHEAARRMRWSCLDIISLPSALDLLDQQAEVGKLFDVVLDKSTSDSIACGSDVPIQLPYPLSIDGWTRGISQSAVTQDAKVHPLHVLAVHLAALTVPRKGRWICISYSDSRFPFLPPYPQSSSHGFLPDSVIQAGFTHPSQLWRLEAKEEISLQREETLAQRKQRLSSGVVHQPDVSHWLYVLVRTDAMVIY